MALDRCVPSSSRFPRRFLASLAAVALAVGWCALAMPAQSTPTATDALAKAAVLEAKGDTAGARDVLGTALSSPLPPEERSRIEVALFEMAQRSGRAWEARNAASATSQSPAAAAGDPIQVLIATLEEGNSDDAKVKAASQQLGSLGPLAIPHLLAALPKAGPFGFRNVAQLLYPHDDPRVAPALRASLDRDPAVAASLAADLQQMPTALAAEFARELAKRPLAPRARFDVMRALRRADADEKEWSPLLDEVVKDRSLHDSLLKQAGDATTPFGKRVLAGIRQHGSDWYRSSATVRLLLADPTADEENALAVLDQVPPQQAAATAESIVVDRPQWTRVALRALPSGRSATTQSWFSRVEWWRRPAESAAALLSLPEQDSNRGGGPRNQEIQAALLSITATGWRAPAELDAALQAFASRERSVTVLVHALPEADGARAHRAWEQLPPSFRHAFVDEAVRQQRPWHRVVAEQIAAGESAQRMGPQGIGTWLKREWRGASPDTVATLADGVVRVDRAERDAHVQANWHQDLIIAYERAPEVLSPVLVALVRTGNGRAFQALCKHEPKLALTEAGSLREPDEAERYAFARALLEHGDDNHVELALRWYPIHGGNSASLFDQFFAEHGQGRLDVVALARPPVGSHTSGIARRAAKQVRAEQFADALRLAPELDANVAEVLFERLEQLKRVEHAAALRAAIEAELPRLGSADEAPNRPEWRLFHYLKWMGELGTDADLPVLRLVFTAGGPVAPFAARAALRIAKEKPRAMLAELLQSPHAAVAVVAFERPLPDEAELWELATAAVLRHAVAWSGDGMRSSIDSAPFTALGPAHAPALAKVLLEHVDAATFHPALLKGALQALSATKDGTHVAAIARAASHPHPDIRSIAAVELGNTFSEAAAPFLLDLLKDREPTVRERAQQALDQIASYLDARAKWKDRTK